jgi:hypothetical protein
MEFKEAKEMVERSLGRAVMAEGFEERYFGPFTVNVLYYSNSYMNEAEYPMRDYRMEVFIDGKPALGHIIGSIDV